jgi:hypothetical protein
LHRLLPRTPVNVKILGGDCSPTALEIHESMLSRVKQEYSALGIRLDWKHQIWDATDAISTSALLEVWLENTKDCEEHLVLVSAFSGFADKHFDEVSNAVRYIAARPHNKMLQFVWIEPDINESKRLLPKMYEVFLSIFRKREIKAVQYPVPAAFHFFHPFTSARIPGKARVIAFEKGIQS